MMRVLVTGGSGFLGESLVRHLCAEHEVAYTYRSRIVEGLQTETFEIVQSFQVDFETGEGLEACLMEWGSLDVVLNCAAISQTALCEEQKETATKINVPEKLVDGLLAVYSQGGRHPLLIHFSSDQVYDGSRSCWKEDDVCEPVNHYGRTKLQAEALIKSKWPNHVILRSSLIYGERSGSPTGPPKFLDFVVERLKSGEKTTFFTDEYRCPIFLTDIVRIVEYFVSLSRDQSFSHVFNMGGPERLSRAEMALQVAQHLGVKDSVIEKTKSAGMQRKVPSPLDISMNCKALTRRIPFPLTAFADALCQIFPH